MKNLMRKSDFAKRCGVSKGRVSQWLKAGQIDGPAIVGEGRGAKLDAALALAQLKLRLSTDERFGWNGLSTNLDWLPADEEDAAEAEAADLAEIEADRRRHVTLLAAKTAVDNLWILMDLRVQATLKPHPEAAAAHLAVRPGLADAKWRIQGVEPPVRGG
jgi:transcriptional regulator with XRE-family HTH domain